MQLFKPQSGFYNFNLIYGQGNADYIYGGKGNDRIDGGSENDDLYGEDGDDTLYGEVGNIIDGGAGIDTFMIYTYTKEDIVLDISNIQLSNIEQINIHDYFDGISLSLQDVLEVTDENNHLIISGDAEHSVTSINQNWVQGIDQTIDGETYHTYSSDGATLLVDTDITQDIT